MTTSSFERAREREDRIVSLVLRLGAYTAITLVILGALLSLAGVGTIGQHILRIGLIVLMCTPISRVAVAAIVFFREGDRHYGWVSLGVFIILLGGSLLSFLKIIPSLEH